MVLPVQSPSLRAWTTLPRASSLAPGATESSRSMNTSSAGSEGALASILGDEPGTDRQERRGLVARVVIDPFLSCEGALDGRRRSGCAPKLPPGGGCHRGSGSPPVARSAPARARLRGGGHVVADGSVARHRARPARCLAASARHLASTRGGASGGRGRDRPDVRPRPLSRGGAPVRHLAGPPGGAFESL